MLLTNTNVIFLLVILSDLLQKFILIDEVSQIKNDKMFAHFIHLFVNIEVY